MAKTPATPKKTRRAPARPSWPDRFIKALPGYGTIAGTAAAVGVARSTVYSEMERNPEFKADVERIQETCVELVETTLYQQALDPDKTTDRIFYLKTRKPEVYGDRLRQDQVELIRVQARQAALQEVQDQLAQLPEAARVLLMEALAAAAKTTPKELTP